MKSQKGVISGKRKAVCFMKKVILRLLLEESLFQQSNTWESEICSVKKDCQKAMKLYVYLKTCSEVNNFLINKSLMS